MRFDSIIILLVIGICFFFVGHSLAFYQWEDENGVVHYGDAPPDTVDNIIEKSENGADMDSGSPGEIMTDDAKTLSEEKKQVFQMPEEIKEVIETITLAPHSRKEISFVAFEPVKVGFKTDITAETVVKCKNSGAGIKSRYSGEEAISPYGGSCEFKPKDGYIKFYVGNLEDFPIKIKVFKQ